MTAVVNTRRRTRTRIRTRTRTRTRITTIRNRNEEDSLPAVTSEESSLQPKKAIVPLAGG